MTQDELLAAIQSLVSGRLDILRRKQHDYAQGDDAFSNFRTVAAVAGVSVQQCFVVWLATKVVRLGQLISNGKDPQNESIRDTLIDIANYAELFYVWLGAEKNNPSA